MTTDNHQEDTVENYRTILLIGPPGSGKGTQGRILDRVPGYSFVSMGEILREVDADSESGRRIQEYLSSGDLVPAQLVVSVWKRHMRKQSEAGLHSHNDFLVLDGAPRNIEQAKQLQELIQVERVIHLACEDESLLVDRIRNRDEGRQDDAAENVVCHRFEVYQEQTLPLLNWYPSELITSVEARRSPLEVLKQIVSALTVP